MRGHWVATSASDTRDLNEDREVSNIRCSSVQCINSGVSRNEILSFQIVLKIKYKHTLCCITFCRWLWLLHIEGCGSSVTVFLTVLAHFVSFCDILVICIIFQVFP